MISFNKKRTLIAPILILIGIIIGLGLALNFNRQQVSLAEKSLIPLESRQELDKISDALSELAAAVSGSVVNISTTRIVEQQQNPLNDLFNNPFFRRFFDVPQNHGDEHREFRASALGSGVIVSSNGHILTNNHVIKGAEKIVVTLMDKRTFKGKVIGADPKTDLALVKIDAVDLPALYMNDKYNLRVGELVIAVGIPFGLSHTVTMGIVSAVGRSHVGIVDYEDFIQTDAAINPGNSGGALVNSNGELVGINTAIFSTSGGNMGVGFAIPVKMAKPVMESLLKYGKVIRGWLGVSIQDITPEMAEYFGMKKATGALISDVLKDGPADKAGLQQKDIVITYNGKPVQDATTLKNEVADTAPGTTVKITVLRDERKKEFKVVLGELPAKLPGEETKSPERQNPGQESFYGAQVQNLTPEIRSQLSIPDIVKGVLVTEVEGGSKAEDVLQQGDVIMQVDRKDIGNIRDLQNVKKSLKSDKVIVILVYRNGSSLFLTLTP